jgi:LCP family protein required for cell wall assembly
MQPSRPSDDLVDTQVIEMPTAEMKLSLPVEASSAVEAPAPIGRPPTMAPSPRVGPPPSAEPPSPAEPPGPPLPIEEPAPRGPRARKVILITLMVIALLSGGGMLAAGLYVRSVERGIDRFDAFTEVPEDTRPVKVVEAADAMNFLILGSDTRDPGNTEGSRSDTIIVGHIARGRSSAQLISIPRDTWVYVPQTKAGRGGRDAKINASFTFGGIPLTVQTVERFTGVRIDHVITIDFSGFQQIVDAIGGIDINVDLTFKSIHKPYRTFTKGKMHLDGAAALDFSRQRHQFIDGDFTRIRHQQQVIKAILNQGVSAGLVTNPGRLNSFLQATANAVSADATLPIIDMAMDLRHLRAENLTFLTSPTKGIGQVGNESVVLPDAARVKALFEAVRRDDVPGILRFATP